MNRLERELCKMLIWKSMFISEKPREDMKGYSYSREDYLEILYHKYFTMEEEVIGCLGVWKEDTDFLLCNGDSDLLPKLYKKDEIRYTYNQYKYDWSWVSCTIFAAVGMASDLTNYQFWYNEIKEFDDTSYNNPDYTHVRKKWEWRYVSEAVKHIRKKWNGNGELVKKYWKLASYCISKYDNDIIENAINNLYTIDWNYCPTSEYNKDKQDLMIDWTNFWYKTNGHSVDVICKEWQRSVKDSWSNEAMNYYGLKHKLSEITNYWPYFYIYTLVKEDNYERLKELNKFKTNAILTIEKLWEMRHQTTAKSFKDDLHNMAEKLRKKVKDIDEQLKLLS